MSKKKAIKKTEGVTQATGNTSSKPASKIVEGADARVLINVYSPGHEPEEIRVTIPNICGSANLFYRSPEQIAEVIIEGLRAKYGGRVG